MKKSLLVLGFMVCFLAFTVGAASAVDFTLADINGNPFCDGVDLTFNPGGFTAFGFMTGCASGAVSGGIGFVTAGGTPGIGATYGYAPDASAAGIVGATEVNLGVSPFRWRHIDLAGNVFNEGILLVGPAAATGAGAGVSSLD